MAFSKAQIIQLWSLSLFLLALFALPGLTSAQEDEKVDFAKDIKPLLESKCMRCHNEDRKEGGFRMDDRDDVLENWVFAEEASESPLMVDHVLSTDKDMMMPPPPRKDPVSDGPLEQTEIDLLARWIDEGADWPSDVELVVLTEDPSAADEEDAPKKAARVYHPDPYNAVGSLHPAVIHLPIGLLLAAGLFALLGLRGNFVMSDCAYYCLWLGMIGSVLACVSGWWFSPMEGQGTVTEFKDLLDQSHKIFWHRTGGLVVTVVAFLLALFAAGARNRDPDDGLLWKLGVILLAGAIGWVGHEGGKLTHPNLYKDLNGAAEAITGWDIDQNGAIDQWAEEEAGKDDAEDGSEKEKEDDEVGKTSEEVI